MRKWIASLCLSELFFYLLCSRINISNAAGMEGAALEGASKSRRKPASFTALAVVGPKLPIAMSFCSKFGKFFISD